MTRDQRTRRFEILAKAEAEDCALKVAVDEDHDLEGLVIALQRQEYQIGVKDGQAIALEAQDRTKVPA